jgi:hypothetical protein
VDFIFVEAAGKFFLNDVHTMLVYENVEAPETAARGGRERR